jgi:hypothetical protein
VREHQTKSHGDIRPIMRTIHFSGAHASERGANTGFLGFHGFNHLWPSLCKNGEHQTLAFGESDGASDGGILSVTL